jgi:hypothetical protein
VCVGCGLCCDGTLFSHLGVLDESDLGPALRQLGVEVIVEAEPPVFALPCPAVSEGVCTVYHLQRPRACSWFECDVSQAVANGSMTRSDALALIDDTKRLRDEVRCGEADASLLQVRVATRFWRPPSD